MFTPSKTDFLRLAAQGNLIPVEEESFNHGARVCRVADDGTLYIALGQPYNVQPAGKVDLYDKLGIGGIVRMNAFDGSSSGGVWTLTVWDDSSICTGTLNSWSLTLDGAPPLPVELVSFEIE